MSKKEKKHARIFVILNFAIFVSLQLYNIIIDSSVGSHSYSELALILCWLILSLGIWKVIDVYEKKRIRDLNLSFLFLCIFCAVGIFIPAKSCYSSQLFYIGITAMIGIAIMLYKRYRSKDINYDNNPNKK